MTAEASSTPQGGRGRAAASARFQPPRLPLLLIVLKGWALTVLTVGAYRFWAVAELRSCLWRNLTLAGERFEYDGRPDEALMRFLIDVAVAVPILAALLFGFFALGDAGPLVNLGALAGTVLTVGFLMQIRAYRARQYLLSHTLWRGIRGGLDGSALAFAAVSALRWIVVLATLGLAYPRMRMGRWSYLVTRARLGNRHFTFEPSGGAPFMAWLIVWLSLVAILIWFVGVNQEALAAKVDLLRGSFPAAPPPPFSILPLAALILPTVFFVRYRVLEFRHVAECVALGRTSLESFLPSGKILFAVLIHWLLVVIGAFAALLMLNRSAIDAAAALTPVGTSTPLFLGLILLVYLSTARTMWLHREVVRTLCRTTQINDAPALQGLEQHSGAIPRRFRRSGAAALATGQA